MKRNPNIPHFKEKVYIICEGKIEYNNYIKINVESTK